MATGSLLLCGVSVFGIHFSPPVASLGMGACFVLLVFEAIMNKTSAKEVSMYGWMLSLLILFQVINEIYLYGSEQTSWPKILVKLPLLLIPLSTIQPRITDFRLFWACLLSVPLSWLSMAGILNYLQHRAFYNAMVLESKPIPLFSQVYHIEYSIIAAIIILISIMTLQVASRRERNSAWGWLLLVSVAINIAALHVFSARTGLLAFYTGVGILVFTWWKNSKTSSKRWIFPVVLVMLSLLFLPSVRNRLGNTADDFMAVMRNEDLNNKSFGQRWIAWKQGITAIIEQPVHGYGMMHVDEAIKTQFTKNDYGLAEHNQVMPHNQFLETALQSGVLSGILLFAAVVAMFAAGVRKKQVAPLVLAGALLSGMVFESLLERQAGVLVVALLIPIAISMLGYPVAPKKV